MAVGGLWVVCGVGFCLFHAADTRSRAELEVLLGESFAGVLSSNDFSVYTIYALMNKKNSRFFVVKSKKYLMMVH
jgi:hypothetical protein